MIQANSETLRHLLHEFDDDLNQKKVIHLPIGDFFVVSSQGTLDSGESTWTELIDVVLPYVGFGGFLPGKLVPTSQPIPVDKVILWQSDFTPNALRHYLTQNGVISSASDFDFADSKNPIALAYDGHYVLLNGTHRFLAALIAEDTTFTVNLYTV